VPGFYVGDGEQVKNGEVESLKEDIGRFRAEFTSTFKQIVDLGLGDAGETGKSPLSELPVTQLQFQNSNQAVLQSSESKPVRSRT
jgi:hypothetical protein